MNAMLLILEIIRVGHSNKITMPIELILENIVYGIPRPLRMCLCVFCNKSDNLFHYVVSELNISSSVHGNIDDKKLRRNASELFL